MQDGAHGFDGIRRGIHADHRVAASVKQTLKGGQENSAHVVDRMIRLHADAEHSALAHGVAAARDIADFRCGQHQVLVAHDLREAAAISGIIAHWSCFRSISEVASSRICSRNSPTVRLLID